MLFACFLAAFTKFGVEMLDITYKAKLTKRNYDICLSKGYKINLATQNTISFIRVLNSEFNQFIILTQ